MYSKSVTVIDNRLKINDINPKLAPNVGKYNFTLNLGGYFGANINKLQCIIRN